MSEVLTSYISILAFAGLVTIPIVIPILWAKLDRIERILREGVEHERN